MTMTASKNSSGLVGGVPNGAAGGAPAAEGVHGDAGEGTCVWTGTRAAPQGGMTRREDQYLCTSVLVYLCTVYLCVGRDGSRWGRLSFTRCLIVNVEPKGIALPYSPRRGEDGEASLWRHSSVALPAPTQTRGDAGWLLYLGLLVTPPHTFRLVLYPPGGAASAG